jgi:uncharacterized membrane protein YphA (DoxX/SURF4 family)
MDTVLWVAQVLLALAFLAAGFAHAFRFDQFSASPRTAWAADVGRPAMRVIGLLEIAGAIGLVLPALTGILPWLTPLAAAGLAFVMLAAAIFHARRGEVTGIVPNAALGAIALFVAGGRFVAVPF